MSRSTAVFDPNRALLFSIAYRMTGSVWRTRCRRPTCDFGDGSPQSVVSLEVAEGRIRAIRLVLNPEKLGNVPPLEHAESKENSG